MNNNALPIILQHVRELAEAQMPATEGKYFKLITPFPPEFNDFPDFTKDGLSFGDPQTDPAGAMNDTIRACEFFAVTDTLYYNYSYGLASQENKLSDVCERFFGNAMFVTTGDTALMDNFNEKKAALQRFRRTTVGDLGNIDFYFSSPSAIKWSQGKTILQNDDLKRLKQKTLDVYRAIPADGSDFLASLIAEIELSAFSKIEYELGFFDVNRAWVDPLLFEHSGWKFDSEKKALYGENNSEFANGDVRLCYAQRYYVIRNCKADSMPAPQAVTASMTHHVVLPPAMPGTITIHDHRTAVRNAQISRKLAPLRQAVSVDDARGNYIWVKDHWERKRATPVPQPDPGQVVPADSIYKVAAVKCRIIPQKPVTL